LRISISYQFVNDWDSNRLIVVRNREVESKTLRWGGTENWQVIQDKSDFAYNNTCLQKGIRVGKKQADIPYHPERRYKNEWIIWGDWVGTGRIASPVPSPRRVFFPDKVRPAKQKPVL
jgi:hypothetical protein